MTIPKYIPLLLLSIAVFAMSACCMWKCKRTYDVVTKIDINRYLGTWYEVARFPHWFEKKLVGVTATYSLRDDNKIDVFNQGYVHTFDGKQKKAHGVARIPDPAMPGRLRVSFFPLIESDYLILVLDEVNYQYALVGSSSKKYLWILSRTPIMDDETYTMLVEKARSRGYAVENLVKVPQQK